MKTASQSEQPTQCSCKMQFSCVTRSCIVLKQPFSQSIPHSSLYPQNNKAERQKNPFKSGRERSRRKGEACFFYEVFVNREKTWYGMQKYQRTKFEKGVTTNEENKNRNTFPILICDTPLSAGTCNCQFINQSLLTSAACTLTAKTRHKQAEALGYLCVYLKSQHPAAVVAMLAGDFMI